MKYPIAIEPITPGKAWRVSVPDLPGCIADGPTVDEAIRAADAAIARWIDEAIASGTSVPLPSTVDSHHAGGAYDGAIWALANVDPVVLADKVERVNITFPARLLRRVDEAAHRARESRSGWLQRVAVEAISRSTRARS